MSQKPSVGRIIHYYAPTPLEDANLDGPYAGIVTGVREINEGEVCSLMTFGPSGSTYPHSAVAFSDSPKAGCWTWPPRT